MEMVHSAHTAHPQEIVHMFLMQQGQEPSDRNGTQQPATVVDDGHIGVMTFDRAQRYCLGRIAREDFNRRGAFEFGQVGLFLRLEQSLDQNLAD